MTLSTGTKLSHYKITSQIGKGGMGEVYQAKDQKLGRDVAIKVLPEEFAWDTDRVARFQREAKLLASLNHPNIAAIHGLEEVDGTRFLVLELVEGQTLAERIKAEPIDVEEALKLGLQIAEALEAAHEKGVIHRDLKPANIKVTPEGKVKVLDFGLAKAFAAEQADLSNSPTLSQTATMQGVILGTAAYMSPEQARGRKVDKRTDIWAFGVVLFEMLTRRSLFSGEDFSSTIARVLEREPDFATLPPNLHPRIRFLLERCLKKEPRNRCHDIADARVDIQEVLADPGGAFNEPVELASFQKKFQTMMPWLAAAVVLTAVIAGLVGWNLKPTLKSAPPHVARFEHHPAEDQQLLNTSLPILAVSPDGRQFVYCTSKGLYLRSLDELEVRLISGAAEDPINPFFSPDGQWVGYSSSVNNKLKKIAISGGTPIALCDVGTVLGASWDLDSTIVYSEVGKGIMRVSASGGTPETLIEEEKETFFHPRLLPDGKSVLFTIGTSEGYKIAVQSLESRDRKVLFKGDCAWYLPTGHIIFTLENNIFAIPFQPDALQKAGERVPMIEGVFRSGPMYAPQFAVSISGTLVYIPIATDYQKSTLVWVDRNGKEESLDAPPDTYRNPQISPDGTRVAFTVNRGSKSDIWIWNFDQETIRPLTFNEGSAYPLWTLDGKRIIFSLSRSMMLGDVYWKAADGMGEEEKLGTAPDRCLYPCSWSGDGNTLVLMDQAMRNEMAPGLGSHIATLLVEGDRKWRPLLQEKFYEAYPQISPDGRWMAYKSGESYGEGEIYVRPFPGANSGKWQVSTGGGEDPLWSLDGRELFYRNDNSVIAVEVQTEPTFKVGKPEVLFQRPYFSSSYHMWDLSPDGKRFLMIKMPAVITDLATLEIPRKINIVLNWLEELKDRVPVN
jgi:Tol biopolymer transport system component